MTSVAYTLKLQNIYVASISCFETFHFNKETKFTEQNLQFPSCLIYAKIMKLIRCFRSLSVMKYTYHIAIKQNVYAAN